MENASQTWIVAFLAAAAGFVAASLLTLVRDKAKRQRAEESDNCTLLNVLPDAVLQFDAKGSLDFLNPAAQSMLGITGLNQPGDEPSPSWRLIDHETRADLLGDLLGNAGRESLVRIPANAILISQQGLEIEVEGLCRALRTPHDRISGYLLQLRDVTEEHEWRRQQPDLWDRDPISALPGHAFLTSRVDRVLQNRRSNDLPMSYINISIEGIRAVYHELGSAAGDTLVRHLAALLRAHVRDTDLISRADGENFAVLLTNCPAEISQKIRTATKAGLDDFRFAWKGREYPVRASIGHVDVPPFEGCLDELLAAAQASDWPNAASAG